MNVLNVQSLEARAGDFALGPVDLTLDVGDYLVLLGPSGGGKTTFLNVLAGLGDAIAGSLELSGIESLKARPDKRGIGYVPQAASLFPHLSVEQNIRFGLRYVNADRAGREATFEKMVDLTGTRELLDRRTVGLSGGEARRVALARALVTEPKLLLLDEPLSMLDPLARREMLDALSHVHDELGTATIHVTHDQAEAWVLTCRCAIMRDGTFVQVGSPEELRDAPVHSFVAAFMGGRNIFPARFDAGVADLGWAQWDVPNVELQAGVVNIRPQSILLAEGGDVQGRVVGISDHGTYAKVMVEVSEVMLEVHMTLTRATELNVGCDVTVSLSAPPSVMKE